MIKIYCIKAAHWQNKLASLTCENAEVYCCFDSRYMYISLSWVLFSKIIYITSFIKFPADRSERIVGGQDASQGQIPSQASLRGWNTTFHFAGGVLISNRWVLTVAQYLVGRANNSINIALGLVTLSGNFTSRRSDLIVIHHDFDPFTKENK